MSPFNPQDALVATMILTAAADSRMSARETEAITAMVGLLPAFRGFDPARVSEISSIVLQMLQEDDGIEQILDLIDGSLPETLRETAYALACDVAAADGQVALEEIHLLEIMRHHLAVDRLSAAAIERGARARHRPIGG